MNRQSLNRQHLYLGGAALAVTLMTAVGAGTVMADTENANPSKMAQAIADKFHINAGDVQGVMNQQHEASRQEMQQKMSDKLDQAVKDGKLTQSQKDELVKRMEAMHDQKGDFRDMTEAERQTKKEEMKAKQDEFRSWLDQQGIDLPAILGREGKPMGMGHPGMF